MKVRYITEQAELQELAQVLRHPAISLVSVDSETLGLNPRQDRLRLLSLAYREDRAFVIDAFAVDIRPLLQVLQDKTLVFHNGLFDLQFMWMLGFRPGQVRDTMLMSQVRFAGRKTDEGKRLSHSLEAVVQRELGIVLPKSLQKSDWSGELTRQQIDYAGRDAAYLLPIEVRLRQKGESFDVWRAMDIECRALLTVVRASVTGVPYSPEDGQALYEWAQGQVCLLEDKMCQIVEQELGEGRAPNWASPAQLLKIFGELKHPMESTRRSRLAESDHPLAQMLLAHREVNKLLTTYGKTWLDRVENGFIYPQWLQCTTATGRMACTKPNFQQIPKDKRYRDCVKAPKGFKLIIADYSGIELRLACKIAHEDTMLAAFQEGKDLHTLTAQRTLGKENVTKDDRQIAKGVNFGALYGAGAATLKRYIKTAYGKDVTEEEAQKLREAFFKLYPKLRAWHRSAGRETVNTRTLAGRWRCGVEKYTEQLNSPVQGSGADGLKMAMALMWERREECPSCIPIIFAHDEICCLVPEKEAEKGAEWVRSCMMAGMEWLLYPVPCEVEISIGPAWGSKG